MSFNPFIFERDGDNVYRSIYVRWPRISFHIWDDGALHVDLGRWGYFRPKGPRC